MSVCPWIQIRARERSSKYKDWGSGCEFVWTESKCHSFFSNDKMYSTMLSVFTSRVYVISCLLSFPKIKLANSLSFFQSRGVRDSIKCRLFLASYSFVSATFFSMTHWPHIPGHRLIRRDYENRPKKTNKRIGSLQADQSMNLSAALFLGGSLAETAEWSDPKPQPQSPYNIDEA